MLQRFIRTESGIVLDHDKQYMLESRLMTVLASPVAKSFGIQTLESLGDVVVRRAPVELVKQVLDAVTTNETFFFRDAPMFEALRTQLLPGMLKRLHRSRKLRIWSAAASSGQEAYSLAMLLRDLGSGATDAEILGTDLSTQVLDRAREGRYAQSEVSRGLPDAFLRKYFVSSGKAWQVCDEVRSMVRFEHLDLRRNIGKLGSFDLVLCRNVLIYFDTETKKQVISAIRPMLSSGGILTLGCAETIINLHDGFRREQIGSATFYTPSGSVPA